MLWRCFPVRMHCESMLHCICGYTCGTEQAFVKHCARFGDSQSRHHLNVAAADIAVAAEAMPIEVRNLSGESLCLIPDLYTISTMADLAAAIYDIVGVPVVEQQLLYGETSPFNQRETYLRANLGGPPLGCVSVFYVSIQKPTSGGTSEIQPPIARFLYSRISLISTRPCQRTDLVSTHLLKS